MSNKIAGKQTYTLDMYLYGYPFETFKRKAKEKLLSSCLTIPNQDEVQGIAVRFQILSLSPIEIDLELSKYRRADGQYVFRGEFVPRETIREYVKKYARVVFLEGSITT